MKHSHKNLLRLWLRGTLNQANEKQLDRQSAEDPFLSEAMEGYRQHPEGRHLERVANLRRRLRHKRKAHILPIAAALAALLGVSLWLLWPEAVSDTPDLAQKTERQKKRESFSTPPPTLKDGNAGTTAENSPTGKADEPARKTTVSPAEPPVASPDSSTDLALREAPSEIPPSAEPERSATFDSEIDSQAGAASRLATPPQKADSPAVTGGRSLPRPDPLESKRRRPAYERQYRPVATLKGKVIAAESGEPLPGASVLLKGGNRSALTGPRGEFALPVDSGALQLIVSYTGYQTQSLRPDSSEALVIELQPSGQALDEIAAAGQKKAAKPTGGYDEFAEYLDQNRRYPKAARDNAIRGAVRLRFRIDPQGRPTDIRVEQSLGYGCDREAIRLLQEGPDWVRPAEAEDQELTYEFRFEGDD